MPFDNKMLAALRAMGGTGGSGGGGSGGSEYFENGIIKQEALPDGYPYIGQAPVEFTWDGNTTGLAKYSMMQFTYYKVGEYFPITAEQLIEQSFVWTMSGTVNTEVISTQNMRVSDNGITINIASAGVAAILIISQADEDLTPGIWLLSISGQMAVNSFTYMGESVLPMDPKYLPMSDIVTAVLDSIPTAEEASF